MSSNTRVHTVFCCGNSTSQSSPTIIRIREIKRIFARASCLCSSVRACVCVCVCVKKSALNSLQKLSQLKVRYVVNLQMMMMAQEPKPKVLTCPAHTSHTKRYTHICIIRMHVLGSSVPKCRFSVPLLNSAFLCIPNERNAKNASQI